MKLPLGADIVPYWNLGIGVILISISANLYICSVRIIRRKTNRIKDFDKYYLCCRALNEYYIFLILAYGCIVVTGFYFYSIVHHHLIWFFPVFLPVICESIVVFYRNWAVNEFRVLGDADKLNKTNEKLHEAASKI